MIVRALILLALLLGTLPAPAAAAPPCHDAGEMGGMAMPEMAVPEAAMPEMALDTAVPPASGGKVPAMVKALCVGCIAPTTMNPAPLAGPTRADARHAAPAPVRPMTDAALTPEPPPPRG